MNNEHTPGFYDLEIQRTKQQYEFARIRLIHEQKKSFTDSAKAELNYINSIEDYMMATQNQNTKKSDETILAYETAYKVQQQKQQSIFQKICKIFQ